MAHRKSATFRPDIEGLRAVAVLLVVLGHARVPGMSGGYIGVDVFFVLSGFLITGLLLRELRETGRVSLAGFYGRRARRILPAASIVLVLTVLASFHWLGPVRGRVIAEDGRWTALFAANLHFAEQGTQYLNVHAPPSPLQHYWSLAVEEQFYLAWPLLLLAMASTGKRFSLTGKLLVLLLMVSAASLAWSIVETNSNPGWAFFSPLTRAWELSAGAMLAAGEPHLRRLPQQIARVCSWAGLAGIIAAAWLYDATTAFPGYAVVLPVLACALAVVAGSRGTTIGAGRILGLWPMQILGRWSYSLYLVHWPLLVIPAQHAGHQLSLTQNLAWMALALVLAGLLSTAVENPIRFARPLVRRPALSLAAGGSLALAAYAVCFVELQGNRLSAPVRTAQAATQQGIETNADVEDPLDALRKLVADAAVTAGPVGEAQPGLQAAAWDFGWLTTAPLGCLADPGDVSATGCVIGAPDAARNVVLFGDSHAAMWMPAFDRAGKQANWRVTVLTKSQCPPLEMDVTLTGPLGDGKRFKKPYPECARWLDAAITRLNELQPDLVVIADCSGCDFLLDGDGKEIQRSAWSTALQTTVRRIHAPVAILGDIPRMTGALDCLGARQNISSCAKPALALLAPTFNDAEREAARQTGATFIDLTQWFCSDLCSPVIGNSIVYTNDDHVTSTYAIALAPVFVADLPIQH